MKFFLVTIVAMAACVALVADPLRVDGFIHVQSLGGFDEYRLEANDLKVLIVPDRSSRVIALGVVYLVGSRNEGSGTSGAAHFLEHLMFRGSKRFNAENGKLPFALRGQLGADVGAGPGADTTRFWSIFKPEHSETFLDLESDRMRGALLSEKDWKNEMTIVRNEMERGVANGAAPETLSISYRAHPYKHPVHGWIWDIENVSIGDMRRMYDTYYWPNNAMLVLMGNFDASRMLGLVRKYFGPVPRSPRPIPKFYGNEPEQAGARRAIVKRPGQRGAVTLVFPSAPGVDDDFLALNVLNRVLAGDSSGRLNVRLEQKGWSVEIRALMPFYRDPYRLIYTVQLAPGAAHADVETLIWEEFERIKREGVSDAEFRRVVSKIMMEEAIARDDPGRFIRQIGQHISAGDWKGFATQVERYRALTPERVKQVARRYLTEDRSNTGWMIPIPAEKSNTAAGGSP